MSSGFLFAGRWKVLIGSVGNFFGRHNRGQERVTSCYESRKPGPSTTTTGGGWNIFFFLRSAAARAKTAGMAIRVNSQSQTDSLNKTGGSCGHLPPFPGFQLSSSSQRNSSGWINSITSINDRGETPLPLRAIHLENRSISPIAHFLIDGCLFHYSVYLSRVACRAARDFFFSFG